MSFEILSRVDATPFPADWYETASEDHFWVQWRFRVFQALMREQGMPTMKPLAGFDVGCGAGVLQQQIEAVTAWKVDGADVNREALAKARRGRGRTMLYNIHDRAPELAERYDFLLLFDVLEHIEEPRAFLASALAHVKPGGSVIVNVPALAALYSAYDEAQGHYRRYDRTSLSRALTDVGLELRAVRYWGGTMLPLLLLRRLVLRFRGTDTDVMRLGFVPPVAWINRGLLGIMRAETAIMPWPWLGTSVMAIAVKPHAVSSLRADDAS